MNVRFDWLNTEICVTLARNAADGGYTKKFVARNVAEVGRDSTAAILRAILHRVSGPRQKQSAHAFGSAAECLFFG